MNLKAYDNIPLNKLWLLVIENGASKVLVRAVKTLHTNKYYNNNRSDVVRIISYKNFNFKTILRKGILKKVL